MSIFGKASHIPSQRKRLVGLLQDAIDVSSRQGDNNKAKKSEGSVSSGSSASSPNQRKLDLVDHYDNLAGEALARDDMKKWEEYSKKAQETDDSVR